MDLGLQMIFATYGWSNVSDEQAWNEELQFARLAADHGFDVLWSVEHHGNDYSFCPDNLQLMSYLAAACPDVGLGTAAVILPWHDPLRVAEQASRPRRPEPRPPPPRHGARPRPAGVRDLPRDDGRVARAVRRGRGDDPEMSRSLLNLGTE
jgi:hypothetical protein